MDATAGNGNGTLAVNLDGTLIATNSLWEAVFALLRRNPFYLLLMPIWLLHGKAVFKDELALRVELDPATMPYRDEVLAFLAGERGRGRQILLVTGAHEKFASAVAAHLQLFDGVIATSRDRNLDGQIKRRELIAAFGDRGFHYIGNRRDEALIFDTQRDAASGRPGWRDVARMLRLHQWLKNLLVIVPLVLAHEMLNPILLGQALLAFLAFSFTASAIYIVNDLIDLPLDRAHARKRTRPLASGRIPIPLALMAAALLLVASAAILLWLPPLFGLVLLGYLVATTAYSFLLKRLLLIDVLALAGLFTLRILAGAAATGTEVSFWLLAFSIFFFLSLALVKRHVELADAEPNGSERIAGRGYRTADLDIIAQAGMASAFASVLVLALYIDSDKVRELYAHPWMVWPLAPMVLYITLRMWILAGRREMHDDPVVFILIDWRSQIIIAAAAIMLIIATLAW